MLPGGGGIGQVMKQGRGGKLPCRYGNPTACRRGILKMQATHGARGQEPSSGGALHPWGALQAPPS